MTVGYKELNSKNLAS